MNSRIEITLKQVIPFIDALGLGAKNKIQFLEAAEKVENSDNPDAYIWVDAHICTPAMEPKTIRVRIGKVL